MHAFLIISHSDEDAYQKAQEIANQKGARLIPFHMRKISDIRNLSQYTKLQSTVSCAYFIEHFEEASIDATNAFLKQLEEPGENTYYILTATSEDKVLPTIVSRAQVVRVEGRKGRGVYLSHSMGVIDFMNASIGNQLTILDKIKKRDDAIKFFQDLIQQLHHELLSAPETNLKSQISNLLIAAQQTLTALENNGNVTSQLSRFVVQINR